VEEENATFHIHIHHDNDDLFFNVFFFFSYSHQNVESDQYFVNPENSMMVFLNNYISSLAHAVCCYALTSYATDKKFKKIKLDKTSTPHKFHGLSIIHPSDLHSFKTMKRLPDTLATILKTHHMKRVQCPQKVKVLK